MNEFPPDCERCVDPFHVVEWAIEALDEVRREAYSEAVQLAQKHPKGKGRPKADNAEAAKEKAEEIKNSAYTLGKAPEYLTENQQAKVAVIAESNNRLYRAYRMKEMLRLLLKLKDTGEAQAALYRLISIYTGVVGVSHPPLPLKSLFLLHLFAKCDSFPCFHLTLLLAICVL